MEQRIQLDEKNKILRFTMNDISNKARFFHFLKYFFMLSSKRSSPKEESYDVV